MKVYCANCKYKREPYFLGVKLVCDCKFCGMKYCSSYNKNNDCQHYKPTLKYRIKEFIELIFPVYEPVKLKKRG